VIAVAAAILALASPVVDRTFVCMMTGTGFPDPYRAIDVSVTPRVGKESPQLSLVNNVDMRAGIATGPYAFGQKKTGELWISRAPCKASSLRVELSSRSLRGGRAERFGEQHACEVPAKVLVRLRAVFTRPVTLRLDRGFWIAKGRMSSAALAVATLRRSPIFYASTDDENARVFTSSSRCVPD
jgi:hypothetical protein